MLGKIFNIQRFCTSDGPGIRTTVFLKGCPLHCLWCHNPESQKSSPEIMYNESKCISCGRCAPLCEQYCHAFDGNKHIFDRKACIACGKCVSPLCSALELSGKDSTVEKIISEVLKDAIFYKNSGGGLTLSGGEPLSQAGFCIELLKHAKKNGLHTCIETCGYAPRKAITESAHYTDLYLFDIKETDPALHKKFTGVDNSLILENLKLLDKLDKDIILRCPLIPDFNTRTDHILKIAQIANELDHIKEIQIEPYHEFGVPKYERLGKSYTIPTRTDGDFQLNEYVELLKKYTGVPVKNIRTELMLEKESL